MNDRRDLKRRLEEDALVGPDGFIRGRMPERTGIFVPRRVSLDGNVQGELCLNFDADSRLWLSEDGWTKRNDDKGLLDQFVVLADASDEMILSFARRWGPMFICSTHRDGFMNAQTPLHYFLCLDWEHVYRDCDWRGREPISKWREQARRVRGTLLAALAIRDGKRVGRKLWEDIYYTYLEDRPHVWNYEDSGRYVNDLDELKTSLTDWGTQFTVPPTLSAFGRLGTAARSARASLTCGFGFMSALWLCLVQAVCRSPGIAVCSSCGQVFTRERKPQQGRDTYCIECGKSAAKRAYKQRQAVKSPTG